MTANGGGKRDTNQRELGRRFLFSGNNSLSKYLYLFIVCWILNSMFLPFCG